MDFYSIRRPLVLILVCALANGGCAQDTLVPAIITFGDSAVDVGNNNYRVTLFKANYPPYGRDFINHEATGRFCNGKLATDFTGKVQNNVQTFIFIFFSPDSQRVDVKMLVIWVGKIYAAETLGFKKYPAAYLSSEASGKNLLIGANFASAAAGYDEKASVLNVIKNFHMTSQYL